MRQIMKNKKLTSFLLSTIFCLTCMSYNAFAQENKKILPAPGSMSSTVKKITNPHELENYTDFIKNTPQGYKLEEVIEFNYTPNQNGTSYSIPKFDMPSSWTVRLFDKWEAKNIKKDSYEIYLPGNPIISDWFDGPCNLTETYSGTGSVHVTSSTGINASIASASIGLDLGYSQTFTKTYNVKCNAKQKINIKVFINYTQWRYDAYKNGKKVGEEFIHKPIGLKFTQAVYTKK